MFEKLVYDSLRSFVGPLLAPLLGSVRLWQTFAVVLLVILFGAISARRWLARSVLGLSSTEHDVEIFKKTADLFDESYWNDLFNGRLYNCWYSSEDMDKMRDLLIFLSRTENRFANKNLRAAAADLATNARVTVQFISRHFFRNLGQFDLYPELKNSQDAAERAKYWKTKEALNIITSDAWESMKAFRLAVNDEIEM